MALDAFETTGSSPTSDETSTIDTGALSSAAPSSAPAGDDNIYTRIIHGGLEPDPATGAILTPIYQSTTFVQDAVGEHKGYTYTRSGNPTVAALERNLGEIEGTPPGLCFGTGMAAIITLFLGTLRGGDHVVISDVVYGGVVRLVREVLEGLRVGVSFVDTSRPEHVEAAINSRTRLVFIKSPANPTLKLTDIAAVAEVAHETGVLLVVDNTFLTSLLQDSVALGADVVIYSTTKYIEGHNSTVGGALLSRDEQLLERLRLVRGALGNSQSPWEAWITLRGLKTLPMRLERHSANAQCVAEWLERHPGVTHVAYPWLDSFPQADLARRQQKAGGGMLTFEVQGGTEPALELMRSLNLCSLAENLGAVETLVTHSASMTHASLTAEERDARGIGDGLIRLSVGLEEPDHIIADLSQALDNALTAFPVVAEEIKRHVDAGHSVVAVVSAIGESTESLIERARSLGRGASDLTALFVAYCLKVARCRLLKDVDGIYETNPSGSAAKPRRYATLDWHEALRRDGGELQHKAVLFAHRHRIPFEVGACGGGRSSLIGKPTSGDLIGKPASGERRLVS